MLAQEHWGAQVRLSGSRSGSIREPFATSGNPSVIAAIDYPSWGYTTSHRKHHKGQLSLVW